MHPANYRYIFASSKTTKKLFKMKTINDYQKVGEFFFSKETPLEVCKAIAAINRNTRIRVWYGKDGVSWDEENDVTGYIGRSTGEIKIPLIIANDRSMGGGGLLDSCIIKIQETKSKRILYIHPNFKQSSFTLGAPDMAEYKSNVLKDGKIYARCKSYSTAIRLADFMNGKRMSK